LRRSLGARKPPFRVASVCLSHALESRVDVGGQEVQLELVGIVRIERMKSESFPPGTSALGEGADDDRSACRLLVELDCGGENVRSERGPDP